MGLIVSGDSELIRLTAIDFFTKEVLIDRLVNPVTEIKHFNTRYSGVHPRDMAKARRGRTCFFGRDAARAALFSFVGPATTIVVHGGSSDFTALRWIHPRVVDSHILEGYFGVKTPGGRSLKNLIKLKLNRDIQNGVGHDSLEDAFAARELVIRFLDMIPDA
jgi:RNA exonuclease 1